MYTVEYYSVHENNERMLDATTWMDLEIIMLSEKITQKDKYHMIQVEKQKIKNELI